VSPQSIDNKLYFMASEVLQLVREALMPTTSKVLEGVDLKSLRAGSLIDVQTESRHYHIECLGGDSIRISGHPEYCPNPVGARVQGSVDEDGNVDLSVIEPGMRLVFFLNHRPVTTSKIVRVEVNPPEALSIVA
jgi:hypothetical protein